MFSEQFLIRVNHRGARNWTSILFPRYTKPRRLVARLGGHRMDCSLGQKTCGYLFSRTAWSLRKLRVAVHSPQCEECTAMLSFSWFPAVREKRYPQDCAHAKGSFRRMCSDGYSTGGATSLQCQLVQIRKKFLRPLHLIIRRYSAYHMTTRPQWHASSEKNRILGLHRPPGHSKSRSSELESGTGHIGNFQLRPHATRCIPTCGARAN